MASSFAPLFFHPAHSADETGSLGEFHRTVDAIDVHPKSRSSKSGSGCALTMIQEDEH